MARRTRRNNAIRAALVAYRHRFADRWPTPGARARLEAAESGADITTDSTELLSALSPIDPAWSAAFNEHPPRRYMLTTNDVLREAH